MGSTPPETGWGKGDVAQDLRMGVGAGWPKGPSLPINWDSVNLDGSESSSWMEVCPETCAHGTEEGRCTRADRKTPKGLFRESTGVQPHEGIRWGSMGVYEGVRVSTCSLGTSNLQTLTSPTQQ